MGDTNQQCGETMEQLLKKVYTVHKDTLKGVNANLTKYKSAYLKILEKCKQLERINDELSSENRKLSTAITTRQSRDGSCCEVIRQSLDTVISSYKQMLADKDARINQLEDELYRIRRGTGNNSLEQLCVKGNVSIPKTSQVESKEQDPDSTSCTTPNKTKQRKDFGTGETPICLEEELVFDTSPDDAVKFKLNRKRSKRSRYSEEVSPDLKKQRHSSPLAKTAQNSDDIAQKKESYAERANQGPDPDNKVINKTRKIKKNSSEGKVLVADTCVPDLNESVVSKGFGIDTANAGEGEDNLYRKLFNTSNVVVVPETVAFDMDDTIMPEDTCKLDMGKDRKKFQPELLDVSEHFEESDTVDEGVVVSDIENDRTYKFSMKNKAEKKDKSKVNKQIEIPLSFRSILESSDSESSDIKERESPNVDIDCGESLVKDSDDNEEDTFFDSLPNSQKFLKAKSKSVESLTEADKSIRNVCRNIKEVDALFETPDSNKGSEKGNRDSGTRKPLFRKGKKECLKKEEQSEVILRRSPRKHKPVIATRSRRTPTKVRTKLVNVKPSDDPNGDNGSGSCKERSLHAEGNEEDDMDETVARDGIIHNVTDEEMDNENETIDCYNVMPVKDGNVIPSKKFQVKVKGIKKLNNSSSDNNVKDHEIKTTQIINIHDQTLKSPSLLGQGGKMCSVDKLDVITVGSSSGKSSSESVESPLIFKVERYKEHIDNDLEIVDWKSAKSQRKKSSGDSQSSLSLSTKRTSLRSSQTGCDFKKPSKDSMIRNRKHSLKGQTTLTQGFFSPKKNNACNKRMDEDGQNSKLKKSVNETEIRVFRELKDENGISTGNAGNNRLNGSLDPSAELSEWCRDPETLPSLDTDFCEADLQSGVNSPPKTSTLAVEDTQDIPCSSTSYKFLPKKHRKKDIENVDPKKPAVNIDDSFDRLPKSKTSDIAHVAVVRKRDERQKLPGHGCKQCVEYYKSAGRSDEEIQQHMHKCSRHRAQYVPPDTPPHFWSVGFIETQENDTSVVKDDNVGVEEDEDAPTYRRRRRLNKCFRSKNENSVMEDDN
ncbi:DNA endonuclease RBBP8-like [Ruditapes philippinarum]|uniref:DNA endonuclease RBBP8-like n=1 Tax=Ruditapes philippinarum TaxID=129788 RepID=UPI00295B3F1F|nr:DNA endonuclease RBBP8-like [Ruditapes philippinarum]